MLQLCGLVHDYLSNLHLILKPSRMIFWKNKIHIVLGW